MKAEPSWSGYSPIVPTTIRWIHCLASSTDFASTEVIFQRKAKMKAKAPIDATSAWAMCVQVVINSCIGVMSGPAARKCMRTSRRFESQVRKARRGVKPCLLSPIQVR
jgi:hypothetical protein